MNGRCGEEFWIAEELWQMARDSTAGSRARFQRATVLLCLARSASLIPPGGRSTPSEDASDPHAGDSGTLTPRGKGSSS
jgi:hypothetical protein